MKLFLIHAGFYDPDIMEGLYEQHTNFFLVAKNVKDAKVKVRKNIIYKKKEMHIDGIKELNTIDGYKIKLIKDILKDNSIIYNYDEVKKIK